MSNSNRKKKPRKARKAKTAFKKPYEGFPLGSHATGRWYKKIKGTFYYFGRIADDPDGTVALEQFNRELAYLSEGRMPPSEGLEGGCTLEHLCNSFLTAKLTKLRSGELSHSTFDGYQRACNELIGYFGKSRRVDDLTPNDFENFRAKLATGAPSSLNKYINLTRIVLKYAFDSELVEKPVRYGQSFDKASAKTLRKSRNEGGEKMFSVEEIHKILYMCNPTMKAMTLLGINCGFGNTDVASLPQSAVDLDGSWIEFPRPKTEVKRRIPLWPETVKALKEAIANRRRAKDKADDQLCFLTSNGMPWVRVQAKKNSNESNGLKVSVCNALAG